MLNKKIFIMLVMLLPISLVNASIVGVGKVGEHYVYKIHDVLILVSPGDIIDGCTVKADSGLQCTPTSDKVNNSNSLRDLAKDIQQFDSLLIENRTLTRKLKARNNQALLRLKAANTELKAQNNKLEDRIRTKIDKIRKIKELVIKKISQKNQRINELSSELNSRSRR